MNTSTYRGRVIWGSDEPWFPMRRSLTEARALPLDDDAMAQFLGGHHPPAARPYRKRYRPNHPFWVDSRTSRGRRGGT